MFVSDSPGTLRGFSSSNSRNNTEWLSVNGQTVNGRVAKTTKPMESVGRPLKRRASPPSGVASGPAPPAMNKRKTRFTASSRLIASPCQSKSCVAMLPLTSTSMMMATPSASMRVCRSGVRGPARATANSTNASVRRTAPPQRAARARPAGREDKKRPMG